MATLDEPRTFLCGKYPSYSIRDIVKFDRGVFVAKTDEELNFILGNDWFGVHIHEKPSNEALLASLQAAIASEKSEKRKSPRVAVATAPEEEDALRAAAMAVDEEPRIRNQRGSR